MSEIDEMMVNGDARGLLRAFAKSELAEREGRFCECEQPDLTGRKSYLCFACGLKNIARKAEIEATMQAPHPYEVVERFRGRIAEDICCDFCSAPRADERHAAPTAAPGATDANV